MLLLPQMGKQKPKLFLLIFVTSILLTTFLPLLQSRANAIRDPGSGDGSGYAFETVYQRAYTWSIANAMTKQGNWTTQFANEKGCPLPDSIKASDAANGEFWGDNSSIWTGDLTNWTGSHVGQHVEPKDGDIRCDDPDNENLGIIKEALRWWGYSGQYTVFLENLGYKKDGDNYKRNGSPNLSDITKVIGDSFFANGDRTKPSDDVLYYIYYQNFILENGCKSTLYKPLSEATNDDKIKLQDPETSKLVTIKVINNTDGSINDYIYKIGEDYDTKRNIGFGVPGGPQMTCGDMANKLKSNAYANGYATYVKAMRINGQDPLSTGTDSSTDNSAASCEGTIPVLGWFVCNVLELASDFASWVDEQLDGILKINTSQYNNDALRTAWSALRIVSTIILVGIALFMIISQMLNIDAVSPYTFKKMIPRLVAAIILMQLSWYLGILLIDIFNVIGQGIADLLAAPFGKLSGINSVGKILTEYYRNTSTGQELAAYTFLGVGIVGGATAVGGGFGLLALSLTVVIAALVAFVTLVLRKVVVLALLLIAPLAIIAWILPNTQNWWKKYFDLTIKLLIMYPLVMGLLTLGKIFAHIVANSGSRGTDSAINFFIIVFAYFAPWFFIPTMIKASGTIFAKASEGISKGGGMMRKAGPLRRVDEAREQNIKARDYNRRARGIERASFGTNPVTRAWGRFQAGTAGSYGRAARQLRADEKSKAISTSAQELQTDLDLERITEYDDQKAYMAAAAAGQSHVTIPVRNEHGVAVGERRIEVRPSATRSASAITWLADRELDDELRAAKASLDRQGPQGAAVWAAANQTHGAKIAGIANDLTGRPATGLSTDQLASQGAGTLRNYAAGAERDHAAAVAGDAAALSRVTRMAMQARRTLGDAQVQHKITADKRAHLEYIASLDTATPMATRPQADRDFTGQRPTITPPTPPGTPTPAPVRNPAYQRDAAGNPVHYTRNADGEVI